MSGIIKKSSFALLAVLFLSSIVLAGSTPNFKEGKWEITTKVEMEGMPMSMPPVKHTQCLNKDNYVPQNAKPGQECEISDTKIAGDTVSWSMKCKGRGGEVNGTGKITYNGDTFSGEMVITMPAQNMKMTNKITGKRIGDCK